MLCNWFLLSQNQYSLYNYGLKKNIDLKISNNSFRVMIMEAKNIMRVK